MRELPADDSGKSVDLAVFEPGTDVGSLRSLYWYRRQLGAKGRPGALRTAYQMLSGGMLRGKKAVVIEAKCFADSQTISGARGQVLLYSDLLAANYGCVVAGKGVLLPRGALTDDGVRRALGKNGIYVYEVDVPLSKPRRKAHDGTKGPLDRFLDQSSGTSPDFHRRPQVP